MNPDTPLAEMEAELRAKLAKVPPRVVNGGIMLTRQWNDDVEKAVKALRRGHKPPIMQAIMVMDLWLQDATPHYHPPLPPAG